MDKERIRNWEDLQERIDKTADLHGNRVADLVRDCSAPRMACPTCGEEIQVEDPDTDLLAEKWTESVRKQMVALVNTIDVIDYNVDTMEDQLLGLMPIIQAMKKVIHVLKETELGLQARQLSSEELSDVLIGAFAEIEQIVMEAMENTE